MKSIFLFILLFSCQVFADSLELVTGGLTYHLFLNPAISTQFSNKMSDDGVLIYNSFLGLKYTKDDELFYQSYSVFGGHNSINEPMGGGLYSIGVQLNGFQIGAILGGYFQDGHKFQSINVSIGDFMPLIGVEFSYKLMLDNDKFLKFNLLYGGIILNNSISFGVDF